MSLFFAPKKRVTEKFSLHQRKEEQYYIKHYSPALLFGHVRRIQYLCTHMEQKRILVVDDEQDLCDILLFNLQAKGYLAEAAHSAEEVLKRIEELKSGNIEGRELAEPPSFHSPVFQYYHLMLLDVMMPGMSGFELAKHLKEDEQTRHIPIIFLTAKDTEDDTLKGFALGADDYVTKPFSVREVMARVKAVLGRGKTSPAPSQQEDDLRFEGLVVNTAHKTVTLDGESIALTRTEYELLILLLRHRGQVFSRQQLLDRVWPQDVIVTERTVDVNVARLRKKLNRYAVCLVSRKGFGYCFESGK